MSDRRTPGSVYDVPSSGPDGPHRIQNQACDACGHVLPISVLWVVFGHRPRCIQPGCEGRYQGA